MSLKLLLVFPGLITDAEAKGNVDSIQHHNPDDVFEEVHVLQPPSTNRGSFRKWDRFVFHHTYVPEYPGAVGKAVRALGWFLVLFRAIYLVHREGIDVIRGQSPFEPSVVAVLAGKLMGVPAIVSLHNDYDTRQRITGNYDLLGRPVLTEAVERFTISRATAVFALTNHLKYYAIQHGATESNVYVLPHKVDRELFQEPRESRETVRESLGVSEDATMLVFVGRLAPQKDPLTLLEGFERAKREDDSLHLVVVGDGEMRGEVEEYVEVNDVEDVTLTGFVQRERVADILNAGDAFVFPTRCEGFGFVFIEAMAAGLPIVTTDIPHTSDIVDEDNALLFDVRDAAGLAERLVELGDDERRERLGANAREDAEQYFTEVRYPVEAEVFRIIIEN